MGFTCERTVHSQHTVHIIYYVVGTDVKKPLDLIMILHGEEECNQQWLWWLHQMSREVLDSIAVILSLCHSGSMRTLFLPSIHYS